MNTQLVQRQRNTSQHLGRLILSVVPAFVMISISAVTASDDAAPDDSADTSHQAADEEPLTESDRNHWSFLPLQPVTVPTATALPQDANPIDQFVATKLESHGLQLQPSAPRHVLLRRLRLILLGLPATPEQIDHFQADDAADAFARLTDETLASSHYGERWAQHWLDLARFAETDGFEHDKTRDEAWKYRDWVIDTFNHDMPYNEFLRQQIAGDELYPGDPTAAVATRFCLSGPDMPDINSQEERRHTVLNELTGTVGAALLALQIGCAECHNHKYDPISQADFYRLRAVFEPALQLKKNQSLTGLSELSARTSVSHLMIRGDFQRPGAEVKPDVPRIAAPTGMGINPVPTKSSTGRRTAFADWLIDRSNPLTARVIVNRVWQHHFGTGLCDTPSDFGLMGTAPTHPELLNWLAEWFMNNGWSIKKLHRLIVSSQTWQQRSFLDADADDAAVAAWQRSLQNDPSAQWLSRFPRQRLEGEIIRDSMLFAAGMLNVQQGGPGVRPPLPFELTGTLLKGQWDVTPDESQHYRRSVYIFARRNLRYPLFDVFDRPSANQSCPVRQSSTTAPQALELLNSEFTLQMSRQLAGRIASEATAADQIKLLFQLVLGRLPTDSEKNTALAFLESAAEQPADATELTPLCMAMYNVSEFLLVE